ncbi:MAG: TIGR04442 family protein [Nitrospirota bacterium]
MIRDLRLHGRTGPVEYFAFVGGTAAYNTYFYEEIPGGIRFFSRGNELTITDDGVHYKGTGGSFCEYMFGVEQPLKDLLKRDIANRLIMFGAFLDENEKVVFTNETEGHESFYRLFIQGHAVKNYYFFIASDFREEYRERQKHILGAVGKFLKRTDLLPENNDTALLEGFLRELDEDDATVFIFKLIHEGNQTFYRTYADFYAKDRSLSPNEELYLEDIASRHQIDRYQQERMKIDVMYRHLHNRHVVDEYRDILLNGVLHDTLHHEEFARLERLRTLGIRNNIPVVLFETLDDQLLRGKKIQALEEPGYLRETRTILQSLFFKDQSLKKHIIPEDIIRLLRAKQIADAKRDKGFEQILLDTVRACDEIARETNDFNLFEEFTSLATYFDRFDNVSNLLSQLAFMEHGEFTEDSLRSLLGNKREFDLLDKGIFESLFIAELLGNRYVTGYGRKKIKALSRGINKISAGEASLRDVVGELAAITEEEKLYRLIHHALKERTRSFFPGLDTRKGREKIREDISQELGTKGVALHLPKTLFDRVFLDIKKESFYLNHLLPSIIQNQDTLLREDFLNNSGLDRFYIETLEREYFEQKKLNPALLEKLLIGGGERI